MADKSTLAVEDGARDGAQAVHRAIAILKMVASGQEQGVRLVDIEKALQLSRPTAHRMLSVLVDEGVLERDAGTRRYLIGAEVALLGLARRTTLPLRRIAAESLEALSRDEGETSFLTIRNGLDSVCIARYAGGYPIKVLAIDVGARRPLGMGVSGVMLLSALSGEERERVLDVCKDRLELAGLRVADVRSAAIRAHDDGYYFSRKGLIPGSRALSVPVYDKRGETVAAVAVAAINTRLQDARLPSLLAALRQCSARISSAMEANANSMAAARPSRPPASEGA